MKKIVLAIGLLYLGTSAFAGFSTRGGMLAPVAVKISFGSRGSGTDTKLIKNVNDVIKKQQKKGLVSMLVTKPWGIEGEFDLCVEYKAVDDAYKSEQQFTAMASKSREPITIERISSCSDSSPIGQSWR